MSKGNNNQGMDEFLLVIGLMLILLFIMFVLPKYQWIFFEYWRFSRIAQFSLFSWIPLDFFSGMEQVRNQLLTNDAFTNIKQQFSNLDPKSMSQLNSQYWTYIKQVDSEYTKYFSWIAAVFTFYLGIKVIRSTSSVTFIYNFETLLSKYSKSKPFYNDLLDKKNRPDLFNYKRTTSEGIIPMTPYEFATMAPPPGLKDNRPIFDPEAYIFDEELARKAFDAQLGNPWRGEKYLTDAEKYIYDQLKKIVEKKTKYTAEEIMNKHAFVYTGLKTLYLEAKDTGVVPPSWFRTHIKYKNTNLWRMISDTGRLPLVMGAGIHAHHELEKYSQVPIRKPATEAAVFALAETIGYDVEKLSTAGYYSSNEVSKNEDRTKSGM